MESPWKIIELTGRCEFGVSISMVPELMDSSPARMRSSVVLPHPLGPTIMKNSPCAISIDTWSTAIRPPNVFETSRMRMADGAGTGSAAWSLASGRVMAVRICRSWAPFTTEYFAPIVASGLLCRSICYGRRWAHPYARCKSCCRCPRLSILPGLAHVPRNKTMRPGGFCNMAGASRVSRRRVLHGGAALGLYGMAGRMTAIAAPAPAPRLPARGNIVIRNAYVMTMEPGTGDIRDGDVHVKDGVIAAVGQKLNAPGATAINGAGTIVLPGLVETHWHMWNTLLRSMSGEKPEFGYFRTTAALGQKFEPGDMYQGTRLAAAEAINSGITFVHDWCHNIRSPEYADQDLRALRESGLRGRFSYGGAQGMSNSQGIVLADLERLARDWPGYSNDGLITLGLAWRGLGGNNPATAIPPEIYQAEIEAGRKLGLPISVHASGSRPAAGQVATIDKAGLLGKDMQVIHANFASPEEIEAMVKVGTSVSLSPF